MSDLYNTPEDVSSDDKLWGLLSYLFTPLIPIIVLLMEDKKSRPFIKYHAVQSIIAFLVITVIATVTFGCGSIVYLVFIYWAIKAYQGEYIKIPVISDFVKNQGWA